MLDIKVDVDRGIARLGKMPDEVRAALKGEANTLATELRDKAKGYAGSLFQVRSGKFQASIKKSVRSTPTRVTGKVSSNDPVAHLLEVGARPHDIVPKSAHALELAAGGAFATVVHHPGFQGHAIISRAFQEMRGDITDGLMKAVREGLAAGAPAAAA